MTIADAPARLSSEQLIEQVVGDLADEREVRTATKALGELRRAGLFQGDDNVEPTPAALHANLLLNGVQKGGWPDPLKSVRPV